MCCLSLDCGAKAVMLIFPIGFEGWISVKLSVNWTLILWLHDQKDDLILDDELQLNAKCYCYIIIQSVTASKTVALSPLLGFFGFSTDYMHYMHVSHNISNYCYIFYYINYFNIRNYSTAEINWSVLSYSLLIFSSFSQRYMNHDHESVKIWTEESRGISYSKCQTNKNKKWLHCKVKDNDFFFHFCHWVISHGFPLSTGHW